ncbi:MAG: flagellar hook-associated protein FlgL [Gracilibacteraceae bacterium]|jgi:flagellar hook-associated protein 3 FlgL|nr:flagellar hook-associated protein FlgL [Gracilibacteraceae bacterium]
MRVTSVMMGQAYKINLNKAQSALNDTAQSIYTERKFQKISDDPAAASRAFQLRQEYSKLESYEKNAKNAQGRLDTADSALQDILSMLNTVKDRIVTAANGTWGSDERAIMAEEIKATQRAIVQNMNLSFTGQYVFGGTQAGTPPLTIDSNGKILFQGWPLEDDPAYYINPPTFAGTMSDLMDQEILVDFGYGIVPGVSSSGFDVSLSAARFLGYGDDGGTPPKSNNLYNALTEMTVLLETVPFDQSTFGSYLDKFNEVHQNFLTNVTNMAAKSQTVEYTLNRIGDSMLATVEKQNYVEFLDPAEAITDWKWQEFAYRSALAIGQQILQPSLLDYLS